MRFKKRFSVPGLFDFAVDFDAGSMFGSNEANKERDPADALFAPENTLIGIEDVQRSDSGDLVVGVDVIHGEPQLVVNCGHLPPLIVDLKGEKKSYRLIYDRALNVDYYDLEDADESLVALFKTLNIKPYDDEDLTVQVEASSALIEKLKRSQEVIAKDMPYIVSMNPCLHRAIMLAKAFKTIDQMIDDNCLRDVDLCDRLRKMMNNIVTELNRLSTHNQAVSDIAIHCLFNIEAWDSSLISINHDDRLTFGEEPIEEIHCLFKTELSPNWSPWLWKVKCKDEVHLVLSVTKSEAIRLKHLLIHARLLTSETMGELGALDFTGSYWMEYGDAILNLERNILRYGQHLSWTKGAKTDGTQINDLDAWYSLIYQTYISKVAAVCELKSNGDDDIFLEI